MSRYLPALSRVATVVFVLALPTALITANVRFLAGEPRLFDYGFRTYDAEQTTGVPMPELQRAGREMVDYFENDEETLRIVVNTGGDEVALFNARETEHMEDVKGLLRLVFRLNEVAVAYVLTYVTATFVWSRKPMRALAQQSLAGLGAGLALVAAVGAFAVTGFEAAWERFHKIAFRNDLWQLDPDRDRLIQMFPEPFWQDMTYLLGVMTVAEVIVVLALSLGYLLADRQPRTRRSGLERRGVEVASEATAAPLGGTEPRA
ncbi:MAG: TIGR01906 family membrane protein [Dehalococcoidia bacterium]